MREVKLARYVFAKFQNNIDSEVLGQIKDLTTFQSAQTRTIPT